MTWFRIGFDDAITHAVHESLRDQLVDDMARRGHPVKDFVKSYGAAHAAALGDNPKAITDWCFDLGGGVHLHTPRETVIVDDLEIRIDCDHLPVVLRELQRAPLRTFADGTEYYKAKFWVHATVLSRAQMKAAIVAMAAIEERAIERVKAFEASLRREQAQGGLA
jgi:hypothetical protein